MNNKQYLPVSKSRIWAISLLIVGLTASLDVVGQTVNLDRLLNATPASEGPVINPVRRAALDGAALTIGTQTGMIERANEIGKIVAKKEVALDQTFRFGDLVIGQGVLPPVIVQTQNAVSVTDNSMRLAGSVYRLEQPARFFSGAPSWRDWLLMGLPINQSLPELPSNEQLLPRNSQERTYWKRQVRKAYESGRRQADEIFRNNLGELVKIYNGMRTFYDLYQRKMVSAPYIASAQEVVTQDDPNMMVVGDTTFRITLPSELNTDAKTWKPLQATPKAPKRLPVVESTALKEQKKRKQQAQKEKAAKQQVQTAPVKDSAQAVRVEPIGKKHASIENQADKQADNKAQADQQLSDQNNQKPIKAEPKPETLPGNTAPTNEKMPTASEQQSSEPVIHTSPKPVQSKTAAQPNVYNPPPLFIRTGS